MAPKPEKLTLSLLGKLGLLPIIVAVLGKSIFATLTGVLVSKKDRPPTYLKHVLFSTFRTLLALQSTAQEQWMTPTTGATYKQFCKSRKVPEQSQVLSDGETKLHWLGDKEASLVLLYFHGGGYNVAANEIHFAFLFDLIMHLKGLGKTLAVAFLEYDCSPYGTYPRQVAQAALSLNDLLKSRSPSHILLGGDSAGGHLALDVLMHIMERHPDTSVPAVNLPEGQKLAAAVLISPWVELSAQSESYKRNAWKDMIPTGALDRWATNFIGGKPRDQYVAPLTAPRELWNGLSDVVQRVYISSGSDEVLVDDIDVFQGTINAEWTGPAGGVQYEKVEGEPHDGILCERIVGGKDIKSEAIIRGWVEEVVSA